MPLLTRTATPQEKCGEERDEKGSRGIRGSGERRAGKSTLGQGSATEEEAGKEWKAREDISRAVHPEELPMLHLPPALARAVEGLAHADALDDRPDNSASTSPHRPGGRRTRVSTPGWMLRRPRDRGRQELGLDLVKGNLDKEERAHRSLLSRCSTSRRFCGGWAWKALHPRC